MQQSVTQVSSPFCTFVLGVGVSRQPRSQGLSRFKPPKRKIPGTRREVFVFLFFVTFSEVSAVSLRLTPKGPGGLARGDGTPSDYYELRIFFQKILEMLIDTRELDTAVN